jgi:hypothetical protein
MVLAMNRAAQAAPLVAADEHEDVADISALIARLTGEVNEIACEKTKAIQHITNQMKMLALNALIESSRAGAQGAGFAVVAQEVRNVGQQVEAIARDLESQLTARTGSLMASIDKMTDRARGERMVDLALNAIELIDRNLYERTCDVRWWATDSAVVDAAAYPNDATAITHVSERLAVILGAYTVYLDLWLCDMQGNVIATGRGDRYAARGQNIAGTSWFRDARILRTGDDYIAGDVERQPLLGNAQVATFCASVREGGKANGRAIGVLAIHFDWEAQAHAIVEGVRVDDDKTRVLLVDSNLRVIAASDGQGLLSERIALALKRRSNGFYQDCSGSLIAFHATPGYETYKGLGWYGVIIRGT